MRKHFLLHINNSATNEVSKVFLTVVDMVIHNVGNNGEIHWSLKCNIQNFKTALQNIKIWNQNVLQNKFKGRKKGPKNFIISFYSKDIPSFNELVIKNTLVKR